MSKNPVVIKDHSSFRTNLLVSFCWMISNSMISRLTFHSFESIVKTSIIAGHFIIIVILVSGHSIENIAGSQFTEEISKHSINKYELINYVVFALKCDIYSGVYVVDQPSNWWSRDK